MSQIYNKPFPNQQPIFPNMPLPNISFLNIPSINSSTTEPKSSKLCIEDNCIKEKENKQKRCVEHHRLFKVKKDSEKEEKIKLMERMNKEAKQEQEKLLKQLESTTTINYNNDIENCIIKLADKMNRMEAKNTRDMETIKDVLEDKMNRIEAKNTQDMETIKDILEDKMNRIEAKNTQDMETIKDVLEDLESIKDSVEDIQFNLRQVNDTCNQLLKDRVVFLKIFQSLTNKNIDSEGALSEKLNKHLSN